MICEICGSYTSKKIMKKEIKKPAAALILSGLISLAGPVYPQQLSTFNKMGVGTSSPQGKLHVASDSTTDPFVLVTSHAITGYGLAVSTGGSVGVGTTAPFNRLHVQGTAGGAAGIYLNSAAPSGITSTLYNSGGNLYWGGTSLTGGGALPAASEGYTMRGNGSVWQAMNSLFVKSDGNVGIGTTAPARLLHLYSTGNDTSRIIIDYENSPGYHAGLQFNQAGVFKGGIFSEQSTNRMSFYTDGIRRMNIDTSGNVGIGTTAPGYNLDVQGGDANASGNIREKGSILVPPGVVLPFAGTSAPSGYLLCAGQAVSRATYAALFAVISTTYGTGDGSTTFNLPDLRGRAAVGKDNMNGSDAARMTSGGSGIDGDTLGAAGGAETHTLSIAQMPSHTHSGYFLAGNSTPASNTYRAGQGDGNNVYYNTNLTINYEGGGGAHNNTQPSIILNYIVKY